MILPAASSHLWKQGGGHDRGFKTHRGFLTFLIFCPLLVRRFSCILHVYLASAVLLFIKFWLHIKKKKKHFVTYIHTKCRNHINRVKFNIINSWNIIWEDTWARVNTGKMLLLIVSLHIGYRSHRKTCNNSQIYTCHDMKIFGRLLS